MLKIKFNINEFTIVFFFLRRLEGKRMLKRSRLASQFSVCLPFCSASVQFSASLFFFSFCFSVFSFFWFRFQRLLLFLFNASFYFFSSCLCFLFSSRVALFFSPKQFSLQPKRVALLSSALLFFFSFLVSASFFSFFFFFPTFLKASPKLIAAQKAHSISPIRVCLFVKMKSNRLPQNQEGLAFHANSQAKKKTSSFSLHSSKTQYSL